MCDDAKDAILALLMLLVVLGTLFGMGYIVSDLAGYRNGYVAACKDCYTGSLKYELKEFPGGEKQWVKKESCK